jgi:Double-GTPase 1
MTDLPIVISGLPGSGKTTFLAALWHLVSNRADHTALSFVSLRSGDATHLNALAKRWRNAQTQIRTESGGNQVVSMNLISQATGISSRLIFPDLSGESFRDMWEERECSATLAEIFKNGEGMLLFVNSDRIQSPLLTVDVAAQAEQLGVPIPAGQNIPWNPRLAPTQVQLVDLLQLLRLPPLVVGFKKIALIMSAWDKVADEHRSPENFVAERLPLLDQYLRSGGDGWIWRVYGVSAQGGDYEEDNKKVTPEERARIDGLKSLDNPSERIRVVSEHTESHDLTEPIAWLVE